MSFKDSLKIVIPMSGLGSRFATVGYKDVKPLIPVDGKPLIAWLMRLFPGKEDPLFICRQQHLDETPMRRVLTALAPKGEIVGIEGAKKGPVDALMRAADAIPDDRPVLISYCDYYMHWDFDAFCADMERTGCDGAVPCYTGFHPHLLPAKNLYACCKTDAQGWLTEIREKHSFDADKTKALHSPGVYYFRTGALFKKYAQRLMDHNDSLGGEFYVSMIYTHLLADGLKVYVPTGIPHFCQWGTPEDFEDYLFWIKTVKGFQS